MPDDQVQNPSEMKGIAKSRYDKTMRLLQRELMVSGSDDFTLFLWNPSEEKKSIARMTGGCYSRKHFILQRGNLM